MAWRLAIGTMIVGMLLSAVPATASSWLPSDAPLNPAVTRTMPAASVTAAGLTVLSNPTLISVYGAAGVLTWVRNDTAAPLDAELVAMLTTTSGGLVGQAKAKIEDLQPGETRLFELTSIANVGAVTGLRFQFTAVAPGNTTPTLIKLGPAQVDANDRNYALVTVTNTDTTAHSGFVSVVIADTSGAVQGIAYGPYSHLNPGQTTSVRCISLLEPIPPGGHLTAQVDTAL